MQTNTAIAQRPKQQIASLKQLVETPVYANRIKEILRDRAPQFVASLMQIQNGSPQLKRCEPTTILTSAITAAALDLPIDKTLGFAHIVPYGEEAQFQMGYKGYIQLALRTGQYKKMNAANINAEAYKGRDEVGDPVIDWEKWDDTKPAAGYAFAWQTVAGFTKIIYWPREKVEKHALQYSQAYKKGYNTPWKTNFDAMALKTVVKAGLSKWGIMSVELRKALVADQGVMHDLDGEPQYPDNNLDTAKPKFGNEAAVETEATVVSADPGADADGDLGPVVKQAEKAPEPPDEKPAPKAAESKPEVKTAPKQDPPPTSTPAPAQVQPELDAEPEREGESDEQRTIRQLVEGCAANGLDELKFSVWLAKKYHMSPSDSIRELVETSPMKMFKVWRDREKLFNEAKETIGG